MTDAERLTMALYRGALEDLIARDRGAGRQVLWVRDMTRWLLTPRQQIAPNGTA